MMLAVGLLYMAFLMLKYLPSVSNLVSVYEEGMLNFIKGFFFYICLDDHMNVVILLMWYITLVN